MSAAILLLIHLQRWNEGRENKRQEQAPSTPWAPHGPVPGPPGLEERGSQGTLVQERLCAAPAPPPESPVQVSGGSPGALWALNFPSRSGGGGGGARMLSLPGQYLPCLSKLMLPGTLCPRCRTNLIRPLSLFASVKATRGSGHPLP